MWPDHCQAFTPGADFYPWFDSTLVDSIVIKWDEECEHPYSAFPGREMNTKSRTLEQIFDEANTKIIQVVWLATDYCVKDTALDLVKTGKYRVEILLQGMRAVSPDTEKAAIELMRKEWIIIVE
jgi:nicotinamidase/pyrazinamidase